MDLTSLVQAHPRGRLEARVCVAGACQTQRLQGRRGSEMVHPDQQPVDGPDPVVVQVTVSDAHGRTVFDATTAARPHKVYPNGPGCPPTAWETVVVAHGTQLVDRGLQAAG